MKHTLVVTLLLCILFLASQVIGLGIIEGYLTKERYEVDGVEHTTVTWTALPYDVERPAFEEETSFLPMMLIVLVATAVILVLMKYRMMKLWKAWFFLSVWFCLAIALAVVMNQQLAVALAGLLAGAKVLWRNMYLHNATELLIYGGLAAVFVPFLGLLSMSILLVMISAYDAIAVWMTKHMVSMAKFQTELKLFAGFLVPYGKNKHAILGGGDIGFPLLFSGVVLARFGWMSSLIVSAAVTLALLVLLMKGKKNAYYPAMPFLSAGCFLGLLISWLII